MIRNYLITALRNLKRNKVYTSLNLFGLALGIGCALVIYKVIEYEMSYDTHEGNYSSIYRVVNHNVYPDRVEKGMGTPHPLGPALKEEFPGIKSVVRTQYHEGDQLNTYNPDGTIKKFLIEEGIAFTEPAFFDIFSVTWLAGDQVSALMEPNTVVIAASEALRLFGLEKDEAHLALSRRINFNNVRDFKIVGIIEDPVKTTSVPFTYLFNYDGQEGVNPYFGEGKRWNSTSSNTNTFFLPGDGFDKADFDQKMYDFVEKYRGEGESEETQYLAQPLSEVHFDKEYDTFTRAISIEFLYALAIIGIFLVVTACINFINMATAQASNRAKEIGVRKAIGSRSGQLVVQFFAEIGLITFFALLLSLAISEVMFNLLRYIIGYQLTVGLFSGQTLIFLLILFLVVTLLSGFYPAVLLSRMNPVDALKRKITGGSASGGLSLRKGLVTLQFAISQFLIIGTLVVSYQTDFFLNKDLGFQTKAIVSSYLPDQDVVKMERFRQEMLTSPAVEAVTFHLSEPTGNSNSKSNFNYAPLESKKSYHANFKPVDQYYTSLFEIDMLAGRSIQEGDSTNIVINRKVADLMGFEDRYPEAIGETLSTGWGGDKKVVGVIENFHTYDLEEDIDYVILINVPWAFYTLSYKTSSPEAIAEANAKFEETWEDIYPKYVIEYNFYDESLAESYEEVQHITALLRVFAGISILIGCLGLYGLVSFIAMNRIKEIGVRKVLGASIFNILGIFSKEIILLMTIAFVITAPFAFYFLSQWLDTFAFSIEIGAGVFVLAFFATLAVAILTISHKTITTAMVNPAETLKDD